jgi:hypothetical protein
MKRYGVRSLRLFHDRYLDNEIASLSLAIMEWTRPFINGF